MSKRKKCQVVIEDGNGVTVRKGNDIAELLCQAIQAHADDPLVLLAVVTACVSADQPPMPEGHPEWEEEAAFVEAACLYAQKVTARWDAEAETEECQGCSDCYEPEQDDRDRLLEEEMRAARDGGDLSKKGGV